MDLVEAKHAGYFEGSRTCLNVGTVAVLVRAWCGFGADLEEAFIERCGGELDIRVFLRNGLVVKLKSTTVPTPTFVKTLSPI